MGHIELAAPAVHIWYLRGTRSWLAYLLIGIEPREELKAKQLEKVIYFAANLVTCVDDDRRQTDLPSLEAEMLGERDAVEKERELELARRMRSSRVSSRPSRRRAPRSPTSTSRRKAAEKDLGVIRETLRGRARAPGVGCGTSSRTCSPARSSRTRCCGASCRTASATTSRAAWAPTPSSSSSTASTSTRRRSSCAPPSTRRRAASPCRPSASRRPSSGSRSSPPSTAGTSTATGSTTRGP